MTGILDFSVNPTFVGQDTHQKELARSRVVPGDVLMNIVGPPLGKVSVVPGDYPEWNMNQAIAVFRPIPGLLNRFLAARLMSGDSLRWAEDRAKATAGQFNLTLEICRDLPVPLPPMAEQERIVAELDRRISGLDRLYRVNDVGVTRCGQLRRATLTAAFSGKLVAQDPTDESASVLLERIRAGRVQSLHGAARGNGRRSNAVAAQ